MELALAIVIAVAVIALLVLVTRKKKIEIGDGDDAGETPGLRAQTGPTAAATGTPVPKADAEATADDEPPIETEATAAASDDAPVAEAPATRAAQDVSDADAPELKAEPPTIPPEASMPARPPTPRAPSPEEEEAQQAHERDVATLRKGLATTRGGFIARLAKLFGSGKREIDTGLLEEIEEVLLTADIGVKTSNRILERLRTQMESGELEDEDGVWKALCKQAEEILSVPSAPIGFAGTPGLILVVGVNGVGKTTTIGKLASRYTEQGKKVLLAAGDTYRAAAVLQLEVWGRRVNCPVVKGKEGADPGSVIFDAVRKATDEGYDLVIADTAGRLHTKVPLMEEVQKVERTCRKALGDRSPDEILLVLDSTTGQNAVQQMHMFRQAVGVTGVALTKLDGTAKGGVILGIVDEHQLPIRFIGLGERVEDLREFDVSTFVEALFAKPDGETLAA